MKVFHHIYAEIQYCHQTPLLLVCENGQIQLELLEDCWTYHNVNCTVDEFVLSHNILGATTNNCFHYRLIC